MTNIPQLIDRANSELKALRSRCRIEQIGDRLVLRGSFPPEPNDICRDRRRGRIFLGVTATAAGVRFAREQALKITEEINSGKFDRSKYRQGDRLVTTTPEIIEAFKAHKFGQGICDRTWQGDYAEVFNKLRSQLTNEYLLEVVLATKPNTRTRRRYCMALGALAEFVQLDIDLKPYVGNYSPSKVAPRNIPTDAAVIESYSAINSPIWQWAYGILAAYGIRPSELGMLNFDDLPVLNITGGKTGERRVYPIYPEWFDLFNLKAVKPFTFNPNQVSRQFKSCGLAFKPYDLRHAWAIRSMEFGLPIELAAAQMGHSMAVHSKTYHRWIGDRHHAKAYEEALQRNAFKQPRS